MKLKLIRTATTGLIGIGLTISTYLLFHTLTLMGNARTDVIDVCSAVFGMECDAALLSSMSWLLGIPLAGWGIIYYVTLASLLALSFFLKEQFWIVGTLSALALAIVGACGSLFLASLMVSGRVSICPLCFFVHAINLSLIPSLKALSDRSIAELVRDSRAGVAYILGAQLVSPRLGKWRVVGMLTSAMVAVVAYQWVLIQTERKLFAQSSFDADKIVAEYRAEPAREILVHKDDAHLGSKDAPVELVVFSSFCCPGCKAFASDLRHLAEHYREQIVLVFKHYPLSRTCNPALTVEKQPGACHIAWAAEAARQQGKFWPFHDVFFASDLDASPGNVRRIVQEVGLDRERFVADRLIAKSKIRSDCQLGIELGVEATPAVFLNGRRVRTIGSQWLEVIIEYLIHEQEHHH